MGVAVRERPRGGAGMKLRSQLFAVKPVAVLLAEMEGDHRLRRVLGPVSLTALGVGAIIGAGIFVLTGLAAHDKAGPGLILSFVVAGIGCALAALCYAEFASMVPVAGSAYTYAYATLGELFAWIIGWDLVLEYAVASSTVAHGWSHYFLSFLAIFGIPASAAPTSAPRTGGRSCPTGGVASSRAPPTSSSPTSASTRSRRTPKRRATRSATCRSASSPRSRSAPCSTSSSPRS